MYSREELKNLRNDFWTIFGTRCDVHPILKTRKRKWMLHRTGIPNVALKFEINRKNAQVMLEISHRNENRRLQVFEIVEKYKPILEEGFAQGLFWEFLYEQNDSSKEVCRIYKKLDHVDFHRKNQWPDIYQFFIDNMLILESNFLEIKDLIKEEIKIQP